MSGSGAEKEFEMTKIEKLEVSTFGALLIVGLFGTLFVTQALS